MATVYDINKGVNRSIEFKGVKAQYIIYLAVGLVGLLLLFAILYICGLKLYYCLAIIAAAGVSLVITIQRFSRNYGEHGLTKKAARRKLPPALRGSSRNFFIQLNNPTDAQK